MNDFVEQRSRNVHDTMFPQNGKPVFPVDRCRPAGSTGENRLTIGRPGIPADRFGSPRVDRFLTGRPGPFDRPADLPGRPTRPGRPDPFFYFVCVWANGANSCKTLGIGLRWGPRGMRFLISDVPLQVQGCLAQKKHPPSYLGPYIITSLIRKRLPP